MIKNILSIKDILSKKNNGESFILTFEYRGKDLESSTNAELNATAQQISQALFQLDEGWSI